MTKTKPGTEPPEWAMEIGNILCGKIFRWHEDGILNARELPGWIAEDVASSAAVKELVEAARESVNHMDLDIDDDERYPSVPRRTALRLLSALKLFQASMGGE